MKAYHQPALRRSTITTFAEFATILFRITTIALISVSLAHAQQSTGGTATLAQTPGAPVGSYALSGFDNVNLFSGNLNFNLPLLSIGGRGSSAYTIPLRIERKWTTLSGQITYPEPGIYWYTGEAIRPGIRPGYSPGVMQVYYSGYGNLPCEVYGDPNPPHYYQETMTKMIFTASDGTEYEFMGALGNGAYGTAPIYYCNLESPGFNRGKVFKSIDGSAMTFVSDENIYDSKEVGSADPSMPSTASGYLLLPDGTRYRINGGLVQWIRDRNGNLTSFSYNSPYGGTLETITDSIGRQVEIQVSSSECGGFDDITYKGFGSAPRRIRVGYTCLGNALRMTRAGDPQTPGAHLIEELFPSSSHPPTDIYNPRVVAFVELPDQVRRYQFYYNIYGELARVELPTGGAIEYDHGAGWVNPQHPSGLWGGGDGLWHIYRRVMERRTYVNLADQVPESRMTYSVPADNFGQGAEYVEVNQFGGSSQTSLAKQRHYFIGNAAPFYYPGPQWYTPSEFLSGKEEKSESLSGSGTLLRRVVHDWEPGNLSGKGPYIAQTIKTLADCSPQLVSKQTFVYDDYNNLKDSYEYAYGDNAASTILLRRAHTNYLTANPAQNGANYVIGASGSSIHIRNLPVEQWISSDSAGNNKVARTTYEYDRYVNDPSTYPGRYLLKDRGSISGLCSSFTADSLPPSTNGVCSNTNSTAYMTRGNVTAVFRWLLSNNTAVATYGQFDIAGKVVKAIDARGNSTEFLYEDNFGAPDGDVHTAQQPQELGSQNSFAFPTKVINAMGHTSLTQYDYYLGAVVDTEEANGVVSSVYYNDVFDRPTQAIIAANIPNLRHQKSFVYDDLSRVITGTSDLRGYNDNLAKGQMFYDGLGRTIESRAFENATEYTTTKYVNFETQQDTQSQTWRAASRVSKPFRPQQGDQPAWTTTLSDSLGRGISVKSPDNQEILTSYSGNAVTVTDQAGKVRRGISDARGRLVRVDEPDLNNNLGAVGNPTQPTAYTYDALDSLRKVAQGDQRRYLLYDSLSRLIRLRNPEQNINASLNLSSDSLCDNNNQWSISYSYDDNGNRLSSTDARGVLTTHAYDALNRIIGRNYSGETVVTTPAVTFTYDATAVAYSKGRLTSVSSSVSAYNYTAYDAMGRVTSSQQVTDGQTYSMAYAYDLADNLTSQTYPTGRIVSNNFDNASRFSHISGQQAGGSPKVYANSFAYAANGATERVRLGNGRWEHTLYNSRSQPYEFGLGTSGTDASLLKLEYDYGTVQNNGNIKRQIITVPTIGTVTGFTATQHYRYDELNRIVSVQEVNGISPAWQTTEQPLWQQSFTYDRFGNRAVNTNETMSMPVGPNPQVSSSTNRIVPRSSPTVEYYSYDEAGNLKTGLTGDTFSYDGESKLVKYNGGATQAGGAEYAYDGLGRRIKKVRSYESSIFVYNTNGQLVAEYTSSTPQNNGLNYLTSDTLGTPRLNTKADGSVNYRHDYLPFGEELFATTGNRTTEQGYDESSNPDDQTRQKFTGYERDHETDLDFAKARMYAHRLGRFMTPDSILNDGDRSSPQSWNLYVYTRNNPLNCTDPTGKRIWVIINEEVKDKDGNVIGTVPKILQYRDGKLWDGDKEYKGDNREALNILEDLNAIKAAGGRAAKALGFLEADSPLAMEHYIAHSNFYGLDKGKTWSLDQNATDQGIGADTDTLYDSEMGEIEGNGTTASTLARELLGVVMDITFGYVRPAYSDLFEHDDGSKSKYYMPQQRRMSAEVEVREQFKLPKRESFNGVGIPNVPKWSNVPAEIAAEEDGP